MTTMRERRWRLPIFEMLPRRSFPPDNFCRGVSPSQAANSRPDLKCEGSVTVVAMAVAVSGRRSTSCSDGQVASGLALHKGLVAVPLLQHLSSEMGSAPMCSGRRDLLSASCALRGTLFDE